MKNARYRRCIILYTLSGDSSTYFSAVCRSLNIFHRSLDNRRVLHQLVIITNDPRWWAMQTYGLQCSWACKSEQSLSNLRRTVADDARCWEPLLFDRRVRGIAPKAPLFSITVKVCSFIPVISTSIQILVCNNRTTRIQVNTSRLYAGAYCARGFFNVILACKLITVHDIRKNYEVNCTFALFRFKVVQVPARAMLCTTLWSIVANRNSWTHNLVGGS